MGEKNGRGKREEMHFCAGLKDQWIFFVCVCECVCLLDTAFGLKKKAL